MTVAPRVMQKLIVVVLDALPYSETGFEEITSDVLEPDLS